MIFPVCSLSYKLKIVLIFYTIMIPIGSSLVQMNLWSYFPYNSKYPGLMVFFLHRRPPTWADILLLLLLPPSSLCPHNSCIPSSFILPSWLYRFLSLHYVHPSSSRVLPSFTPFSSLYHLLSLSPPYPCPPQHPPPPPA